MCINNVDLLSLFLDFAHFTVITNILFIMMVTQPL